MLKNLKMKHAALMLTASLAVMFVGCAASSVPEAPAVASTAESAVTAPAPAEEEIVEESTVKEENAEGSIVKGETAEESAVKEENGESSIVKGETAEENAVKDEIVEEGTVKEETAEESTVKEEIIKEGIVGETGESDVCSGSQASEESKDSALHSDSRDSSQELDPVLDIDWDRIAMGDSAYDDEVYAIYYLSEVANLQSKPETGSRYCVVDMRENHESYDIDWDYGSKYEGFVTLADWSKVFDIGYYETMFPMLALQYHYDEDQLLRHFQTVGIHEGRQGSENFNVGVYMDWCTENLPYTVEAFDGDYALYYLFYASAFDDQPDSFPADGRPAQYKAVMTYSQAQEFDAVNNYRAEKGLDPYVYDSEMTAFANFRAWTNQDQELVGHTWLFDSRYQSELSLCFDALGAEHLGENTIENNRLSQIAWHKYYADSKSHYEAMVNPGYRYFGTSHAYVDSVAFKNYSARAVQFDTFSDALSTAMNP